MPLLNKRRISFTPHIRPEMKRRRKQVYYLKCTKEVFPTYESYIKRWTLCNRPIWECEVTGRQHLTYKQAQESEQADQHRVEYKFCPLLRKQLLSHIQFQTIGLDDLAQDLFNSYLYDFATGEIVFCLLAGHTYLGQIMDVIQNPNYIPSPSGVSSSDRGVKEELDETKVPRQANGRLRFPDAFLHPEPNATMDAPLDHNVNNEENQQQQPPANQHHGNGNKPVGNDNNISPPSFLPHRFKYRVQLVDNDGAPLEKSVRILDIGELSRDPQWFNPTMLRRLIRESTTRDSYIGAPWLLKEHVAAHHGIPSTLPASLQQAQDQAYINMIKKRQPHFPRRNTLTSNDNSNNMDQYHHHHHHHHGMNGEGVTNPSWFIHNTAISSSASPSSSSTHAFDLPVIAKEEREAEKQARKEEHLRLKIQQKMEKDRIREERKKQAAVKYPIEDLDLPIYRKDPNHHWMLVDMTPTSYSQQQPQQQQSPSSSTTHSQHDQQQQPLTPGSEGMLVYQPDDRTQVRIPYPCGGRGPRPIPNERSCIGILNDQQFESMMVVWSFLTVFSVPLQLPTMTIETFETSLVSTSSSSNTPSSNSALVNSFASLLNVIIKERLQGTTSDIVNGDLVDDYLQENDTNSEQEGKNDDADDDDDDDKNGSDTKDEEKEQQPVTTTTKRQTRQSTRNRTAQQQRENDTSTTMTPSNNITPKDTATSSPSSASASLGWRDAEPLRICKDWDQKEIKPDRKNWIVALIGCLNDVATPDLVPGMDSLLHHLLPRSHCTIAERDRQFASLEPEKKLQLLSFLMDVTNETLIIKNYMDKCQDQMTELRRQKVELNKEYKLLAVRRTALEKRLFQQQQQENTSIKLEKDTIEPNQDTNDSTTEMDEDDIDEDERDDMDPTEDDDSANDTGQSEDMDSDDEDESPSEDDEDSVVSDSEEQTGKRTSKRKSKYGQLHRSRQAKLQKKRRQREQQQAIKNENTQKRRRRPSLKKRQESPKGTLKQQKQQQQQQQQQPPAEKHMTPLDERQQLDEEEQELKRKEDQLEREMRQYMTLRIRPLGKDRFFQRYLYLDNVGTPDHHGTGRLYVQSPTYVDILQLMDRDHHPSSNGVVSGPPLSMIPVTTASTGQNSSYSTANGHPPPSSQGGETAINQIATPAWGRGGGRAFVLELMKEQGLLAERDWMMQRMDELQQQQDEMKAIPGKLTHSICSDHPVLSNHLHRRKQTSNGSWWYYYSNPYQIQQLLAWLNPKGVREYKLRNEIIKQQHYLVESMQKHEEMENEPPVSTPSASSTSSSSPMTSRVTRNKKI